MAARWTIAIASLLVLIYFILLACSIPNYRVTIDSAFHVSMARAYAYRWWVPWDRINFGPGGRPNLQGPLLYFVMGVLGRLLGGSGHDFVLANATLAEVQWMAAVATVSFFAYRLRGDGALLMAVALFCGAGFAATSFTVGIPSGWLFILTPWAIYLFLSERLVSCTLVTAAAVYVHIAGCVTAPVGVLVAAALTGRWRSLFRVGIAVAILSSPYLFWLVRYAGWLSGVSSRSALLIDPMLDTLALIGAVRLFKAPRQNAFMIAWLCAPVAWLFRDSGRFFLQSALAGSVAASLLMVELLEHFADAQRRAGLAIAFAAVATLIPFGLPALASETAWDMGLHYPHDIDWNRARRLENDPGERGG